MEKNTCTILSLVSELFCPYDCHWYQPQNLHLASVWTQSTTSAFNLRGDDERFNGKLDVDVCMVTGVNEARFGEVPGAVFVCACVYVLVCLHVCNAPPPEACFTCEICGL